MVLSLLSTAIACGFAGLCYAEFASISRVAGSAYSYAYATLGELFAWIIGWDLVLEYAVGNVAVAIPWSGYFQDLINPFLHRLHQSYPRWFVDEFPKWLGTDFQTAMEKPEIRDICPRIFRDALRLQPPGRIHRRGDHLAAFRRHQGERAVQHGDGGNQTDRAGVVPDRRSVSRQVAELDAVHAQRLGRRSSRSGRDLFRLYRLRCGFDRGRRMPQPQRDLPIGILGSLAICTIIYMLVAFVLTGMMPWQGLNVDDPLSAAMLYVGEDRAAGLVAFGAVVATTAVLLVFQLGQTRILYAMSRDRLLPAVLAKTHPRFRTPHVATIVTGLFVGGGAALSSMDVVVNLCNIGTLFAFVIVCAGVLVLRWRNLIRGEEFHKSRGAARLARLLLSAIRIPRSAFALRLCLGFRSWASQLAPG